MGSNTLLLDEASIVNGLQTTKAVVQQPSTSSYVLAKVVQTARHWEIAKAANFQNQINRIDLDLAEYIRPHAIRTAASHAAIGFQYKQDADDSIFAVLETIYQDRISYQEVRSLFVGLFSRDPSNTIDPDYGQLRVDVIELLYESQKEQGVFTILFNIQRTAQRAAEKAQELYKGAEYAGLFQRFWDVSKPSYRAFLTILAVCGCVRTNIYEGKGEFDYPSMKGFLESVNTLIDQQPEVFTRYLWWTPASRHKSRVS